MFEKIPTAEMDRIEWLKLRKTGIGGSDAGAICGLNPYASPMSVYLDKTRNDIADEDNESMRQGRDLEDYVARRFMEDVYKRQGELDFYVRSLLDYKNYGIEVKAGSNSGSTVTHLLKDRKIDYIYYLKGDTYGGSTEDGQIWTVPHYLADRIGFDLGV